MDTNDLYSRSATARDRHLLERLRQHSSPPARRKRPRILRRLTRPLLLDLAHVEPRGWLARTGAETLELFRAAYAAISAFADAFRRGVPAEVGN